MFNNHFKILAAQLFSRKLLALINVLGLAAALTCCLFIALFVRHELGYDSFFQFAARTHRISMTFSLPDGTLFPLSSAPGPVGSLLVENFPEVQMVTRFRSKAVELKLDEEVLTENEFDWVDENFFTVFDLTWLQGDQAQALSLPNAVVLTQSMARQYFGDDDPLGRILLFIDEGREVPLTVTGVIADLPSNTHLTGRAFVSADMLATLVNPVDLTGWWGNTDAYTYVVLEPGSNVGNFDAQLARVIEQYASDQPIPGATITLQRTPLTDIHMQPPNIDELRRTSGNPFIVYAFSAIGVGILAIACVNFINIATVWATRRTREVGVRKVLGATRGQLVRQFIAEALLLCGTAMLLALAGVETLLPTLNRLLGIDLRAGVGNTITTGMVLLAATMALGLLAGWYPSMRLAATRPASVLKGLSSSAQTGVAFRGVLVVLQFSVVIVLLVTAVVVQLQLKHVNSLYLGFGREYVVRLNAAGADLQDRYIAFRDSLLQNTAVVAMSSSSSSPVRDSGTLGEVVLQGDDGTVPKRTARIEIDYDYFDTYDIRLLSGRVFSRDYPADAGNSHDDAFTASVVINERTAREFGWTLESAIGKSFQPLGANARYVVIGVVADTIEHARLQANPTTYYVRSTAMAGEIIAVRVQGERIAEALAHIDETWTQFNPGKPVQRVFLDDTIAALYVQDTRQLQLAYAFSALAIVIACMGLYGLVAFSTECRTKEIGVRKVMGGSVWSIVWLLTNHFSKLVLLANLLAWPLAYVATSRWLASFAYRIDLTPLMFVGSSIIVLCIAWVTAAGTTAKAASAKPVLALRYE